MRSGAHQVGCAALRIVSKVCGLMALSPSIVDRIDSLSFKSPRMPRQLVIVTLVEWAGQGSNRILCDQSNATTRVVLGFVLKR
jgi:hypothetical protein